MTSAFLRVFAAFVYAAAAFCWAVRAAAARSSARCFRAAACLASSFALPTAVVAAFRELVVTAVTVTFAASEGAPFVWTMTGNESLGLDAALFRRLGATSPARATAGAAKTAAAVSNAARVRRPATLLRTPQCKGFDTLFLSQCSLPQNDLLYATVLRALFLSSPQRGRQLGTGANPPNEG